MRFTKSQTFSIEKVVPFNPCRCFIKGYNPVRIKYIGENIANLLEVGVFYRKICSNYQALKLSETSTGIDFLSTFGDGCFGCFGLVWSMLLKQPYGEAGVLSTNGTTNIFVVAGKNHSIYTIGVFWYDGGWSIRGYPLIVPGKKPRQWFAGNQIIVEVL